MASMWQTLPPVAESAYKKALHTVERAVTWENIFEKDWDVCVLLDACRYDLFQSVSDNYDFIGDHSGFTSADSMTPRWMERTFTTDVAGELKQTAYICGNPFSERWVDETLLGHHEPVYQYGWDDEIGTVRPDPVTDAAIRLGRDAKYDRLLIHYMQPHVPFVNWDKRVPLTRENFSWEESGRGDTWIKLKAGEVSLSEVKKAYRENLEYVLDELELLVHNLDAERAILTSDHGNGYGEWGIYGHPMHMPLKPLRKVPWAEIEMKDVHTHKPVSELTTVEDQKLEEQLRALGYR